VKRKFIALLCGLALLAGCLAVTLPAWAANPTVYLLAVNNKFGDLPGGALPVSVNGVIYIPYTVFDKDATGVDLGVYYGIKQDRGTVLTLYSPSGILTFSVNQGTCVDGDGNAKSFRAVLRGSTTYVPAQAVCDFFGLRYSYLPTSDRGILIRICSSAGVLTDDVFLSAGDTGMLERYNKVLQSLAPSPSPSASPTPTARPTPTPTPPPAGSSKEDVRVYLAVDASTAVTDLTALFPSGVRALFLFTPDSLTAQAALVRKAVAQGHSVGLLVSGDEAEVLAQLERGNALLTHIARTRAHIVAAPDALTTVLEEQGWLCWKTNVSGATAATLLANLNNRRLMGKLTLPASPSVISQVVSQIRADGYDLRQPLETDL